MIQALRISDIVRKYNTPKVYRALVNYHCKKLHFQQIKLPIEKKFKNQSDEITLYLSEFKIVKDREDQINPVKLVPVKTAEEADIYYTYWNRLHFYKLPPGMMFAPSKDPF